jgi:hypothetical protein
VDALSGKTHCNYLPTVHLTGEESNTRVLPDSSLHNINLTALLREVAISTQKNDEGMTQLRRRLAEGDPKEKCFREDAEGTLWFKALKKKILDEAHISKYSIHLGCTKMYHDLRGQFLWTRRKHKTARYVLECDTCRKVKADYMKTNGLLQLLSIPDWKWEDISMDFIVGLPASLLLYGRLSIDSPCLPTLYPCTPTSKQRSMLRYTLLASYVYMESQRQLFQIEDLNLSLISGRSYMLP